MASGRDKPDQQHGGQSGGQSGGHPSAGKSSGKAGNGPGTPGGRMTVDSRGRNVWQWGDEGDSTSILLKKLENDALALEPTRNLRRPEVGGAEGAATGGAAGTAGKGGKDAGERDDGRDGRSRTAARREPGDRIRQYPDRSGTKPGNRDRAGRDPGRPSGSRRGGGFDPYNSG